ncbi:MAG TPA: response regulator transcription factor [Clostridia bacterium]|nr:response regulator transcription factor [Clostridia bacterium]
MYQIMVIEDDPVIQEELSVLLKSYGYEVILPKDFSDIINEVMKYNPHLLLLDINLPEQDGFKICSRIRTFSSVPIIFVTSRNRDMDELNSIMLGGDDFITKPYSTPILLARISSLLKRTYASEHTETMTYQEVTLHMENSTIEHQDKVVELTKTELKMMLFLFRNVGKIVSRADLVEYLWDSQLYVDDNVLSVNMTRIREKLKQIGVTDFIRTKHRQGYMI